MCALCDRDISRVVVRGPTQTHVVRCCLSPVSSIRCGRVSMFMSRDEKGSVSLRNAIATLAWRAVAMRGRALLSALFVSVSSLSSLALSLSLARSLHPITAAYERSMISLTCDVTLPLSLTALFVPDHRF